MKTKCPAVLRLVFHDAGTYLESAKDGGMNASVRYELNRPESFGLKRGLNVVKSAYDALDGTAAEGKVSFADMISCAGAYAYYVTLVADPWHKPNMTKDEAAMAEHIGLPSDQYMREDAESMKWIKRYANDQDAFFTDFVDAYLRLTRLGADFA